MCREEPRNGSSSGVRQHQNVVDINIHGTPKPAVSGSRCRAQLALASDVPESPGQSPLPPIRISLQRAAWGDALDSPCPPRSRARSCASQCSTQASPLRGGMGEEYEVNAKQRPPLPRSPARSCSCMKGVRSQVAATPPPTPPLSPGSRPPTPQRCTPTLSPAGSRPPTPQRWTPPLSPRSRPPTPQRVQVRAPSADNERQGCRRRPSPLDLRTPGCGMAAPTRMPPLAPASAMQPPLESPETSTNHSTRAASTKFDWQSTPWATSTHVNGKTLVSIAQDENPQCRPYMEDGHQVLDPLPVPKRIDGQIMGRHPDEHWAFFAVYDGHGGRQAVDWIEAHFHTAVATELRTLTMLESGHHDRSAVVASLTRAFEKIDAQLATLGAWKYGSTATVALVHTSFAGKTLYVANVGDSRAVLVGGPCVQQLSIDHRASDPAEVARVQSEGGVVFRKRVGGVLSVSRALGDHQLKGECGGVSSVPDVSVTEVDGARALVMASDGLWDVLNAVEVQDILQNCIQSGIESRSSPEQLRDRLSNSTAQALVEAALQQGSRDNILALVAFL